MIKKNNLFGFTLIEMMVGISVGLFVVGGALTFYATSVKSSSDTIKGARLNQDLNVVMQLIVNEVRRAGYGLRWGVEPVIAITDSGDTDCILYVYNDDRTVTNNYAIKGFRLDNNSTINMGSFLLEEPAGSGTAWSPLEDGTDPFDTLADTLGHANNLPCGSVSNPLTDPGVIDITEFNITDSSHCTRTTDGVCGNWDAEVSAIITAGDSTEVVKTLLLDITLRGELVSDSSVAKTLTQSVRVVNNMSFTVP